MSQLAPITPIATEAWSDERREFIRQNFCANAPDQFVEPFLKLCERRNLSPEANHIYLVPRYDKGTTKWTPQVSIDGYRMMAARTGQYGGSDEPVFWEGEPFPTRASVTVYRIVQGVRCPFTASAYWSEYYPGEKQGFMWRKMPHVMLAKVAESAALRKAFPEDLSGLYTTEEMEQSGSVQEASFREVPPAHPQTGEIADAHDRHHDAVRGMVASGALPPDPRYDVPAKPLTINERYKNAIREKDANEIAALIQEVEHYDQALVIKENAVEKGINGSVILSALMARPDAPPAPAPEKKPALTVVNGDRLLKGSKTEYQMNRIFAIAKEISLSDGDMKRYVKETFDLDSRADLSHQQAEQVIAWLESLREVPF